MRSQWTQQGNHLFHSDLALADLERRAIDPVGTKGLKSLQYSQ